MTESHLDNSRVRPSFKNKAGERRVSVYTQISPKAYHLLERAAVAEEVSLAELVRNILEQDV